MQNTMYTRNAQSERLKNALEMERMWHALADEQAESKIVCQIRQRLADNRILFEHVYPERVESHADDGGSDVSDGDDDNGDKDDDDAGEASVHTSSLSTETIASPSESSREEEKNDSAKDDRSLNDDSYALTADEISRYGEAANEETETYDEENVSFFADVEQESGGLLHRDGSDDGVQGFTDLEAHALAYTLEKYIDRVCFYEVLDGVEMDSDDHGSDRLSAADAQPPPRTNRALVLQIVEQTARELKSRGTYETLFRLNATEAHNAHMESELQAEYAVNEKKAFPMGYKQHRQAMKRLLIESKIHFQEQLKIIMDKIQIEDDYFQARQVQRLLENKEIRCVKERILQEKIQAIDNRIVNEVKNLNEAKHIFSSRTIAIIQHLETWENLYSTEVGIIDREIMTLEHVKNNLDDSLEEVQTNIDQWKTQNNEYEELMNNSKRKNSTHSQDDL